MGGEEQSLKSAIIEHIEGGGAEEAGTPHQEPEPKVEPEVEPTQEVAETPEPEEPRGEEGEQQEPETEEAEVEEPQIEVYEIPDDGTFVLEVKKGEEREYSGTAVKQMLRQAAKLEERSLELKAKEAEVAKQRETIETERTRYEQEFRAKTVETLLKANALIEDPQNPGKVVWNPVLSKSGRLQVTEKAEEIAKEAIEPPKFSRDLIPEDERELYPEPMLEYLEKTSEMFKQYADHLNSQRASQPAPPQASQAGEEEQVRQAMVAIKTGLDSAIASQKELEGKEGFKEWVFQTAVERIGSGQASADPAHIAPLVQAITQEIPKKFGIEFNAGAAPEEPSAPKGNQPAAKRVRRLPPRAKTPPAVGGDGRSASNTEEGETKNAPRLGTKASRKEIEEALRQFS